MTTLLLKNAHAIATFDDEGKELRNAFVFVRDGVIETIGSSEDAPDTADEVIDALRCIVIPGLVNTHHHMYQTLTRAIPAVQDAELFIWLKGLYPIWARMTPAMIHTSALTAMAELLLSGCTTSSDHLYLYPNGAKLDDTISAAQQIGMRFHAMRGSMSVGESTGGLPPDSVVENEAAILKDSQRVVDQFHDANRYAMIRVGLAPCSPFSVSTDLMRESATLARSFAGKGVRLHTHLAENDHDIAYSREKFNKTPTEYAESLGWLGDDVWHAHCVKLDAHGIARFAATGTGVAHCPCSNMRLASGIAPIRKLIDSGVRVGLGVDGSASNDSSHMLNETRQTMLLARVGRSLQPFGCDGGGRELSARDALRLATRGGASVLGRDDIGVIAPGMAADLALFRIDTLAMAGGAVHDPIAALMFCASPQAEYTIVNGRVVVREGQLTTLDLQPHIERHNRMARQLVSTPYERPWPRKDRACETTIAARTAPTICIPTRRSQATAMQLIGMLNSPYVRRCVVSMALLGIPFEHRSVSVFRHMDTFKAINPLVKAPTLVCDDGTVLHDSNLILQYAETLAAPMSGKTLWPRDTATLTTALRITANALVAMEKTVQCVYEQNTRPPEKQHQPWLDRVTTQLQTAYDLIEVDVAKTGNGYLVGNTLTQADISVAAAWGFTQFTQADRAPKSRYPAIAAFAARMETMPELVAYPVDRE